MSNFTKSIITLDSKLDELEQLIPKLNALAEEVKEKNNQYSVMIEAQQLLGAVSEENTSFVLDYITSVINKTLGEMFPFDKRSVFLEKKLHAGKYTHINVKLTNGEGIVRDLVLQSGTGLRQVISFLFLICLIELRKSRSLFLMDEILNGLHPTAKRVVQDIMTIFAEEGFQFIFVEHSGMGNFGRRYLIEKPDAEATATLLEGTYKDEVFIFNRPVETVDLAYFEPDNEPEDFSDM